MAGKRNSYDILGVQLDGTQDDINKAFLHHYSTWVAEGLVPRMPNTRACYRFLANDCSLTFDVSEKSFSEFIRRQIF